MMKEIREAPETLYTPYSCQSPIQEVLLKVKVKSLSPVQLFVTPWTVAYEATLSMGFSRQ